MKFSIYLFNDSCIDFDGLIEKQWLEPEDGEIVDPKRRRRGFYTPIESLGDIIFEHRAYIHTSEGNEPKWLKFLQEGFRLGQLLNGNNSFVLFIRRNGRIFAYTFGYSYAALDYTKIEQNFGLKTALNMIGTAELRRMEAKSIESIATYRQVHASVPVPVATHDVNVFTNFITSVSSKPTDIRFGNEVKGSDCLQITRSRSHIFDLGTHCSEYYDYFTRDDYKTYHSYIDYVQPVNHNDALLRTLDSRLLDAFLHDDEKLFIMQPRIQLESPDIFKVNIRDISNDKDECEYLDIDFFKDYYNLALRDIANKQNYKHNGNIVLKNIQIQPFADNDLPMDNKRTLYDYLIFECNYEGNNYVFSNGSWYSIKADYFAAIQDQIDHIPDVSDELRLPEYNHRNEGFYNIDVSRNNGWKCLDKGTYRVPNQSLQQIEVCDILTSRRDFLCIKKMRSSAAMSHLFSQVSVSAELLQREFSYRRFIVDQCIDTFPEIQFNNGSGDVRYVIGIITDKPGPISQSMFAFSKISLIQHLYSMGYTNIALCKIHSVVKVK